MIPSVTRETTEKSRVAINVHTIGTTSVSQGHSVLRLALSLSTSASIRLRAVSADPCRPWAAALVQKCSMRHTSHRKRCPRNNNDSWLWCTTPFPSTGRFTLCSSGDSISLRCLCCMETLSSSASSAPPRPNGSSSALLLSVVLSSRVALWNEKSHVSRQVQAEVKKKKKNAKGKTSGQRRESQTQKRGECERTCTGRNGPSQCSFYPQWTPTC